VIEQLIDLFLHLDVHLVDLADQYGLWIYALLFLVVFAETGLVVAPFLPGDSLLFATGALAATGALDLLGITSTLALAAILGDSTNYWIGRFAGPKVFKREKSWFFNPEHLQRTHAFYEKHGGTTIIIARFMPIIRTFAPFVAGIGRMQYLRFLSFSVVGTLLWVPPLSAAGYFFGNLPAVKQNFSLVIFAIIGLSLLPMVVGYIRQRKGR
jgi:membrane-associated protein